VPYRACAPVLAAHGDIATVPAPGFRAWISDATELLVPVIVTAILERTAVVHSPGRSDGRRLIGACSLAVRSSFMFGR
jgi:hypothetical protein